MMPNTLCIRRASILLSFAKQIFFMKFSDTPNYAKLRFSLISIILDLDEVPSNTFDWSSLPRGSFDRVLASDESYDHRRMENIEEEADSADPAVVLNTRVPGVKEKC